ncbi:Cyclopropane-fatty-acyl-phospholipid synthase [compost metagenome]
MAPVIARAGLGEAGVERFGGDYADTLAEWARRFESAWGEIARKDPGFDDRFRRLWRFYLAYCEAGFRSGRTNVIQMALQRA